MVQDNDIRFMRRCLDLAAKGEGMTCPNPQVGAVVVHDDVIIGEGYHIKAGGPHAEVSAVNSVTDRDLLKNAVLYVNLEPCSHYGKTPPCVDLITSSGIKKVIIGTIDTSDKVAGSGIAFLKDAGCEVVTGVLEQECRWINRRFFTFNEKKRPYIILKWAQSRDGYIDINRQSDKGKGPVWITGSAERVLVHKWRATEQAILAGAGTIRKDDPRLNVREWAGNDPLRLVLSSSGQIDGNSAIFRTNGTNIVFTHKDENEHIKGLKVKLDKNTSSARQVAGFLFNKGIQSVIVEGGREVLDHFISTGYWDEARIFYGRDDFKEGIAAPEVHGRVRSRISFSRSVLELISNEMIQQPQGVDI